MVPVPPLQLMPTSTTNWESLPAADLPKMLQALAHPPPPPPPQSQLQPGKQQQDDGGGGGVAAAGRPQTRMRFQRVLDQTASAIALVQGAQQQVQQGREGGEGG